MKRKRNTVRGNVCVGVIAVRAGLQRQAHTQMPLVKKQKEEVTMMKPIKTEADYQRALARLEQIFDARPGTEEGDELEVLAILVEHYENQRFPIDLPDPVEAIQFRMEQLGLKQNDLAKLVGSKSHISEVLNRKRKLTLEMIRRLSKALAIPAEVLIQTY
jgi:HTH-type transcriptional regulator/antitoxin HigA